MSKTYITGSVAAAMLGIGKTTFDSYRSSKKIEVKTKNISKTRNLYLLADVSRLVAERSGITVYNENGKPVVNKTKEKRIETRNSVIRRQLFEKYLERIKDNFYNHAQSNKDLYKCFSKSMQEHENLDVLSINLCQKAFNTLLNDNGMRKKKKTNRHSPYQRTVTKKYYTRNNPRKTEAKPLICPIEYKPEEV